MNWAMKTTDYDHLDNFVIQYKNRHKWLKELHGEVRSSLVKPIVHQPYVIKKRFGNWRDKVVDWYNEWVKNGFMHSKKHLYLFGPPDTGKTNFLQFLFGIFLEK